MGVDPDRDGAAADAVAGASALLDSAAASGWRGPDAYDGLWYPWPAPMVAGRRRRQVLMQLHARSPVDVRRLYRRSHPLIPKAVAIYATVGLRLHRLDGGRRPLDHARDALAVLMADRTAGEAAWGYHWDMQTRWSFYPAGSPNVVVTAFAVAALLEAHRHGGGADYLERARQAAAWVRDELWVEPDGYFAYHPGSRVNIHNANLLGAWVVAAVLPEDDAGSERVRRAIARTLGAQRADGTWGYGEGGNLAWADSFHTGYVLSCLARLRHVDARIDGALTRGLPPYLRFFDADGTARLWADRRYPEDAHSAGTGLTTLAVLEDAGAMADGILTATARRSTRHNLRDGHAVYRRYRWGRTTVRYLRWADAHVALGLVDAAARLRVPE